MSRILHPIQKVQFIFNEHYNSLISISFFKKKSIGAQILMMRVPLYRLINKNSNNIYNNFNIWRMVASLRVNRTFSSNVIDF